MPETSAGTIDCALAFQNRGDFYKTAYVALLSCFAHTASTLRIHLIIDAGAEPYAHFFQELCDRHGHSLILHPEPPVPADVLRLFPGNAIAAYTPASLFRLCMHEFIPADKLIYIDCDIVFERDIADLHALELGDAYMIAAHDPSRRWSLHKKSYYLKALGIAEHRYFNSGVLLFNLKKLREDSRSGNVFWDYYRLLAPRIPKLRFPLYDQDLLNAMLSRDEDKLRLADASFNYELCLHGRRFFPPERLAGKILHFAALKPWAKFFPAHLLYWAYYAQSPWGKETIPLISRRLFDANDTYTRNLMRVWPHPRVLAWLASVLPHGGGGE